MSIRFRYIQYLLIEVAKVQSLFVFSGEILIDRVGYITVSYNCLVTSNVFDWTFATICENVSSGVNASVSENFVNVNQPL